MRVPPRLPFDVLTDVMEQVRLEGTCTSAPNCTLRGDLDRASARAPFYAVTPANAN